MLPTIFIAFALLMQWVDATSEAAIVLYGLALISVKDTLT